MPRRPGGCAGTGKIKKQIWIVVHQEQEKVPRENCDRATPFRGVSRSSSHTVGTTPWELPLELARFRGGTRSGHTRSGCAHALVLPRSRGAIFILSSFSLVPGSSCPRSPSFTFKKVLPSFPLLLPSFSLVPVPDFGTFPRSRILELLQESFRRSSARVDTHILCEGVCVSM